MASMASMANLWVHSFLWDKKQVLLMLCNNTEDAPVSLAQCLPAICIRINIPNMLLRCGKILCTINAFLFLCQLIFDLIKWHLLDHHRGMDKHPPSLMLFLHEDILACTLVYEQELQHWRIVEPEAGCSDPGRPTYEEASGCFNSSASCLTCTLGIWWYGNHTTSFSHCKQHAFFHQE